MSTAFFGGSFFGGEFFSVAVTQVTQSGGFPIPARRGPDDIRRDRERFGIVLKAAQGVIDTVAKRQAEAPPSDAQQRFEELERELQLAGIEWETRYLEALNTLREQLINAELAKRIRVEQQNSDVLALLLMVN